MKKLSAQCRFYILL